MNRIFYIFVMLIFGMLLFPQEYDGIKFTKAPNTAYLEDREGNAFEFELDYLYTGADSQGIEINVHMFVLNPVVSKWNSKFGLVGSFPVGFVTAETDAMNNTDSAGISFFPSVSLALKMAGDLQENHLLIFGGLTVTPVNRIWVWNDLIDLQLSMPGVGFNLGIKGILLMSPDFTLVPFALVQFNQIWMELESNGVSVDVDIPMITSPLLGVDLLIKGYSLGASVDFAENATSFQLHFRIPISRKYSE
jgi:hypothetical protein